MMICSSFQVISGDAIREDRIGLGEFQMIDAVVEPAIERAYKAGLHRKEEPTRSDVVDVFANILKETVNTREIMDLFYDALSCISDAYSEGLKDSPLPAEVQKGESDKSLESLGWRKSPLEFAGDTKVVFAKEDGYIMHLLVITDNGFYVTNNDTEPTTL